MKRWLKRLVALGLMIGLLGLVGCSGGGHEYEGNWTSTTTMSLGGISHSDSASIIIGKDFIESAGKRQIFDKMFERKQGGDTFFVSALNGQEMMFKVSDGGKKLMHQDGMMTITMVKN